MKYTLYSHDRTFFNTLRISRYSRLVVLYTCSRGFYKPLSYREGFLLLLIICMRTAPYSERFELIVRMISSASGEKLMEISVSGDISVF